MHKLFLSFIFFKKLTKNNNLKSLSFIFFKNIIYKKTTLPLSFYLREIFQMIFFMKFYS